MKYLRWVENALDKGEGPRSSTERGELVRVGVDFGCLKRRHCSPRPLVAISPALFMVIFIPIYGNL